MNHISPGGSVGLPVLSVGKGTVFPLSVGGSREMLVVRLVLPQVFFGNIVPWLLGEGAKNVAFLEGRSGICQMVQIPFLICNGMVGFGFVHYGFSL